MYGILAPDVQAASQSFRYFINISRPLCIRRSGIPVNHVSFKRNETVSPDSGSCSFGPLPGALALGKHMEQLARSASDRGAMWWACGFKGTALLATDSTDAALNCLQRRLRIRNTLQMACRRRTRRTHARLPQPALRSAIPGPCHELQPVRQSFPNRRSDPLAFRSGA